jgi:hypothetical protein
MDWGTVIIAIATVVTGIATCISAYVTWWMWRGALAVDWGYMWNVRDGKKTLEVEITVHNETSSIFDIKTVEVRHPAAVIEKGGRAKDGSWSPHIVPIFKEVPSKKSVRSVVHVAFDWPALATSKRRSFFSSQIVELPIQATLVSRSSRRQRRRFTTLFPISRKMIATTISEL